MLLSMLEGEVTTEHISASSGAALLGGDDRLAARVPSLFLPLLAAASDRSLDRRLPDPRKSMSGRLLENEVSRSSSVE